MRKAIGQFTEPLAARGIPWAVTYGNHDFQCGLNNAELDGIYREFPGCVNPPSETLPEPDCIYLWSGWRCADAVWCHWFR